MMKRFPALLLYLATAVASASGLSAGGSGVHGVGWPLIVPDGTGLQSSIGSQFIGNTGSGWWVMRSGAVAVTPLTLQGYSSGQTGPLFTVKQYAGAPSYFEIANDGTVTSGKPCDAGFSRAAPNYCKASSPVSYVSNIACTALSVPAHATSLLLTFNDYAKAANVANTSRFGGLGLYTNSGCTLYVSVTTALPQANAREYTATTLGTVLARAVAEIRLDLDSTGQALWYYSSQDAGGQSSGSVGIAGYWD